jgi:hypothetical protein
MVFGQILWISVPLILLVFCHFGCFFLVLFSRTTIVLQIRETIHERQMVIALLSHCLLPFLGNIRWQFPTDRMHRGHMPFFVGDRRKSEKQSHLVLNTALQIFSFFSSPSVTRTVVTYVFPQMRKMGPREVNLKQKHIDTYVSYPIPPLSLTKM